MASERAASSAEQQPKGAEEALDVACAQILEPAALRVESARSAAEREASYRLRYRCVVEEGWADPSEFREGMEHDAYDERAVHICAWEESELAGTVRLVFPQPGVALPIEREFGVELRPPGEVVDGGRLVVASTHRGDLGVLTALFARCWLLARKEGLRRFASVAPERVVRLYRRSGLIVEVIGEARTFWGEKRLPILLTGADPEAFFGGTPRRVRSR